MPNPMNYHDDYDRMLHALANGHDKEARAFFGAEQFAELKPLESYSGVVLAVGAMNSCGAVIMKNSAGKFLYCDFDMIEGFEDGTIRCPLPGERYIVTVKEKGQLVIEPFRH